MFKLVSPIENGRWSFLNGYHIFSNVVWLMDKNEIAKYKLIDENDNEVNINIEDCLTESPTF